MGKNTINFPHMFFPIWSIGLFFAMGEYPMIDELGLWNLVTFPLPKRWKKYLWRCNLETASFWFQLGFGCQKGLGVYLLGWREVIGDSWTAEYFWIVIFLWFSFFFITLLGSSTLFTFCIEIHKQILVSEEAFSFDILATRLLHNKLHKFKQ